MSYEQQIQNIMEDWLIETNSETIDADAASKWAVETERYKRKTITMEEMCKRDMLKVLREARHEDPQGRTVKTRYSLRYVGEQGTLKVKHLDLRKAKPAEMFESFSQHYDRLGKGVHRHATDVDSYNDNGLYNQQIPLFDYNMSKFVELNRESTQYDDEYDDTYDDSEGGDSGNGDAKAAGKD
jgi:hypothetical protein